MIQYILTFNTFIISFSRKFEGILKSALGLELRTNICMVRYGLAYCWGVQGT